MTTTRTATKRHAAFTLVELLVVIAIVSLLVALLLPGLSKARSIAIRTKCASTVRAMSQANIIYANEYDGYLAPFMMQMSWNGQLPAAGAYGSDTYRAYDLLDSIMFGTYKQQAYWSPNSSASGCRTLDPASIQRNPGGKFNLSRTCPQAILNSRWGEDTSNQANTAAGTSGFGCGYYTFGYNTYVSGVTKPGLSSVNVNHNQTNTCKPFKLVNIPRPSDCLMFTDVTYGTVDKTASPGTWWTQGNLSSMENYGNAVFNPYNDLAQKNVAPSLGGAEHDLVFTGTWYKAWNSTTIQVRSYTGSFNLGCADGSVRTVTVTCRAANSGNFLSTADQTNAMWDGVYMDPTLQ